jgi:hypothetical protein
MQRIGKLRADKFYELIDPFYVDLSYYYKSLLDDVTELNKKSVKQKWTPQQLEHEIDKMFALPDESLGMNTPEATATVLKAVRDYLSHIVEKSHNSRHVEKGKALPVGTIRERSDGKYRKESNGEWVRIAEGKEKNKEDIDRQIHYESEEEAAKVKAAVTQKWGEDGLKKIYDTMCYTEDPAVGLLHLKIDPTAPYRIIMTMTEGENKKSGAHAVAHFNMKNNIMVVQELYHPDCIRGDGTGASRLWEMMNNARTNLKAKRVNVQTKRKPNDASYYVAARLGAYKVVKVSEFKSTGGQQAIGQYLKNHNMPEDKFQLSDLMKTPEGRELWRNHGFGMFVSWNPKPTSDSMKNLSEYAKKKMTEAQAEKKKAADEAIKPAPMKFETKPEPAQGKPTTWWTPTTWTPPSDPDLHILDKGNIGGLARVGVQPTSEKALKTNIDIENKIRNRKTERGVCYDKDGNVLFAKNGSKNRIGWYPSEMYQFYGCELFTHNHPSTGGASFSFEDIHFAVTLGIKELRACSAKGAYICKINFKQIPHSAVMKQMTANSMRHIYKKYRHEVEAEVHKKIKNNEMTYTEANLIFSHEIITRFFGDEQIKNIFNIDYRWEGLK